MRSSERTDTLNAALELIRDLFARAPRLGWDSWGLGYELGEVG